MSAWPSGITGRKPTAGKRDVAIPESEFWTGAKLFKDGILSNIPWNAWVWKTDDHRDPSPPANAEGHQVSDAGCELAGGDVVTELQPSSDPGPYQKYGYAYPRNRTCFRGTDWWTTIMGDLRAVAGSDPNDFLLCPAAPS